MQLCKAWSREHSCKHFAPLSPPWCSFCEGGGLGVVLRLLQHPELQYLATTALLSLLGTWTRSAAVTSAADRAVQAAAQSDITQVRVWQACGWDGEALKWRSCAHVERVGKKCMKGLGSGRSSVQSWLPSADGWQLGACFACRPWCRCWRPAAAGSSRGAAAAC